MSKVKQKSVGRLCPTSVLLERHPIEKHSIHGVYRPLTLLIDQIEVVIEIHHANIFGVLVNGRR